MDRPGRRLVLLIVVAAACLRGTAAAQARTDVKAAADVVLAQLEAFRRGDYDTAYTFASETIRQIFDRPHFEQMVRGGYPEIARSRSATVHRAAPTPDGRVYLSLRIVGANGRRVEAVYEMVQEADRWKIAGVVSREADDLI
jgi:hypothetical protein